MAVPKKRKSFQKRRQVKAGKPKIEIFIAQTCPNCNAQYKPHCVCSNCGYYNGRVHKLKSSEYMASS